MKRLLLALGVVVASLSPVPAAAQTADGSDVELTLAAQTPLLGEEGTFVLDLAVEGAPEGAEVEVTVHGRLRSRSAFVQSIESRPRGTTTRVRAALADLPDDGAGNRRLALTLGGAPPLALPARLVQGVYPVTVVVEDDGGDELDHFVTHLVRLPDDPELTPLSVAWIQPFGADPAISGELRAAQLAALAPVLDALATTSAALTLEATPETLAALPASELEPIRAVLAAGAQLPARPYVDVDPDALLAAGLADDLARQRQAGEDALLATVGTRGDPRTWTTGDALGSDALAALGALGVTRMALPESSLEPLDEDLTDGKSLSRPFDLEAGEGRHLRAVAIDAGLVEHFRTTDPVLGAHRLLADLAVLFFDAPGTTRGVAVRPPDNWRPASAFLDVLLPALEAAPILQAVTVEELLDRVDPLEDADGGIVRRQTAGDQRSATLPGGRIRQAVAATDELAELVGSTLPVVADARIRILVAESADLEPERRLGLLDEVLVQRDEIEDRITIADRRTFRLTAREGTIPLTVVNENAFPVDIQLVLSSDKLEFTDASDDTPSRAIRRLTLAPGTHTETVPVKVRASGTFLLRASVLAPGGEPIRRGQFTITSSAFSGVGVVLSIGAGVFLLAWWASHWRTVRRDRRLVQAPQ